MEQTDRELLIRIEERVKTLSEQFAVMSARMSNDFVSKTECALNQQSHDNERGLARAESISKIVVLISVASTLIWAVMRHV